MKIQKDDINKIRIPFRIIAAFGAIVGFIGIVLLILLSYIEQNFGFILIGIIPFGLFVYVMGLSAATGYPPKYLYFASSKKE